MFAGFNLKLGMDDFKQMIGNNQTMFNMYKELGEKHLKGKKAKYEEDIENYILKGTVADGTKLEDDWFPKINADIFISHSHRDKELVFALAGWLHKEFGVDCFIDSCVWGYIDKLLEKINDKFSDKKPKPDGGALYNHEKCNTASKHVNIMLCMALQKMIDKVEAVFVVNTPNSISGYEEVYKDSTFSPWIYSEIVCTQIVRNKDLLEYRKPAEKKALYESHNQMAEGFGAVYKLELDHLEALDVNKLKDWRSNCNGKEHKEYLLDELYKITYPIEMKKLDSFYKTHNFAIERSKYGR